MLVSSNNVYKGDGATQELLAYVQDTLVADKAYANRDEFIYAGNLYRTTAAIAQGGQIILSGENANVILCNPIVDDSYRLYDEVQSTLEDGDYFPFYDSSEFRKKKTLWSTIKAHLKAYFDPYYAWYATNYTTSSSYNKIKVNINSGTSWMLCFVVTLYSSYRATKIMISGYNYGVNYWYSPQAVTLGDTSNSDVKVYFGYDSVSKLWVGFDCGMYVGIRIDQVTNGYTQVADKSSLFTITLGTSISGTTQTTVTSRRPTYVN